MGGASSMSRKPASQQARSVVWLNEAVIVASNDGTVSVGLTDDKSIKGEWYHQLTDSLEWIECMAVSPDHKWLAVGSHDNIIYVYNIDNKFKLHSKCKGHSSYINSLDWSKNSDYLRSTSGAHDLLFWDMPQGTQDVYGRQKA